MRFSLAFLLFVIPVPMLPASCDTPDLEVCILVKPKGPGLSFDPFAVSAHSKDGSSSPIAAGTAAECPLCPPDATSPPKPAPAPAASPLEHGGAAAVTQPTAFELRFPTRPPPTDAALLLELGGFRLGDRPVTVPLVQLIEARKWSCHLLPVFRK